MPALISLLSSSPPESSPYSALSVTERAKISRSSPASDLPLRIVASARNGGRSTALCGIQFSLFFERARSPAAARRRTSVMGRQILLPSVAKLISMLMETTERESIFPARANATTDPPRDLFPTVTWKNVNWTSPGVALLTSMARLGKSSQTFFYFSSAGSLARMMP